MPIFEFVKGKYNEDGDTINDLSYKKWFNNSFTINLARRTKVLNVEYRDTKKTYITCASTNIRNISRLFRKIKIKKFNIWNKLS